MVSELPQHRVREIGIVEHAEEAEGHDVGHGVGHFALVGVDGRRHRHDGRHAADARARGDRACPAAAAGPGAVEPRHEHQAGRDGREHHRQARDAQLEHVEHAQADADEHDAEAQHRGGAELQARRERVGQRQQVAQQQAQDDGHRHAGDRAAAGEALRGQHGVADSSASQKPASITATDARRPGTSFMGRPARSRRRSPRPRTRRRAAPLNALGLRRPSRARHHADGGGKRRHPENRAEAEARRDRTSTLRAWAGPAPAGRRTGASCRRGRASCPSRTTRRVRVRVAVGRHAQAHRPPDAPAAHRR